MSFLTNDPTGGNQWAILGTVVASAAIQTFNWIKTRKEVKQARSDVKTAQMAINNTNTNVEHLRYDLNGGALKGPIESLTEVVDVLTAKIDRMGHEITASIIAAYPPNAYNAQTHQAQEPQQ